MGLSGALGPPLCLQCRILTLTETNCRPMVPEFSDNAYLLFELMQACLKPIFFNSDPAVTQYAQSVSQYRGNCRQHRYNP